MAVLLVLMTFLAFAIIDSGERSLLTSGYFVEGSRANATSEASWASSRRAGGISRFCPVSPPVQ